MPYHSTTVKIIPNNALQFIVSFQPIVTTKRLMTLSPSMAPIVPNAEANPATIPNLSSGNQIVANFNTPTKAKAEPNPTKKRPINATQNKCVEENIKLPNTQIAQAADSNNF